MNYRTAVKAYIPGAVQRTRFPELAYQHRGDHWRILNMHDVPAGTEPSGIGPLYPTRAALVADLERYAAVFGCT